MIRKYRYGTPFDTEALTEKIETTESTFPYGEISQNDGFAFTYIMDEDDIVYGLGESNRGINKRGYCYISNGTHRGQAFSVRSSQFYCREWQDYFWTVF